MQSKNAIATVHTMSSMCSMYKSYLHYLEHRHWTLLPVRTWRPCDSPFKYCALLQLLCSLSQHVCMSLLYLQNCGVDFCVSYTCFLYCGAYSNCASVEV